MDQEVIYIYFRDSHVDRINSRTDFEFILQHIDTDRALLI